MKHYKLLIYIFVGLVSGNIHATDTIKHIYTKSINGQTPYFEQLLNLALSKSTSEYGSFSLESIATPMSEKRQMKSVNDGSLDVIWMMTSKQREQQGIPVRIPLLKGLLGYRLFVTHKNQQSHFYNIANLETVKSLTAVQGLGWADVDILRKNNFKVEEAQWNSTIYKTLHKGFYDYFPRSIMEVWSEMGDYDSSDLVIEQQNLLIYPTAIYFFVGKQQPNLAKRIEYGLLQAINDGSFETLLTQYPTHVKAFEELKMNRRAKHFIHNPLLPKETPLTDSKLWFEPFPQSIISR